jgi:hypothetical protein
MDAVKVEKINTDNRVYDPKTAQTLSAVVVQKNPNNFSEDTFKKKPVVIFGEVPVNKQIVFTSPEKSAKIDNVPPGLKASPIPGKSDTAKDIMNGASIAADGISTVFEKFDFISLNNIDKLNVFNWSLFDGIDLNFLDGVDVLGVQSLKFIATGLRMGVNYKDLRENLKKGDDLNTAWAITNLSKTSWGLVVGGMKTWEASTSFGATLGMNTMETALAVGTRSQKITNFTNKIAIPFAVATTGLHTWELITDNKKITIKEKELEIAQKTTQENIKNSNVLKRPVESDLEKKLKGQIGVLNTNSKIMTASVGFSALSTAGLIASVVFPNTAKVATPVFMVGNVLASVTRTLSDDQVRTKIVDSYGLAKTKYHEANVKYHQANDAVNRFLVR